MNPIEKMLQKFTPQERELYREIVQRLEQGNTLGLNIKQLKGFSGVYRVRKRRIRIIFSYTDQGAVDVLALDRRSEDTYRKF